MKARPIARSISLAAVVAGAACANDYDALEFRDLDGGGEGDSSRDAGPDRPGSGGTNGTAGSGGGNAGAGGQDGSTGTGGAAGAAAADGGATGGAGGSDGSGGTGGTGTGGTGGTGGTVCENGEIECNAICVDPGQDTSCGGCDNDCTAQGQAEGLECIQMLCGCTNEDQCGAGPNIGCGMRSARCYCDGTQCRAGETCVGSGSSARCGCNGGDACSAGQICCQSSAGCQSSCD